MFGRRRKKKLENGFVNALQWDELRRTYGNTPSQTRGIRYLTAAMQAENPELADITVFQNRRANWNLSFLADSEAGCPDREEISARDVDSCFTETSFWSQPELTPGTFAIQIENRDEDPAENYDLELGLYETVQELSRFLKRHQVRRVAPIANEHSAESK